jgi:large subunit ribosomal protein L15
MKLHDLRPAEGAHKARTRVGRGIAAGKGKTAGRGTKGQKARAGGSIPPWFEGGQTPLHMRIPKLRGFKNRGKIDYEIVNVGDIAGRIDAGAFAAAGTAPKKGEAMTINADVLRAVGLVRDVRKPLKILGNGDLSTALFVVADAFTKSASEKITAAGGSVNVLEVPTESRPALGADGEPRTPRERRTAAGRAQADQDAAARSRREADAAASAPATSGSNAPSAAVDGGPARPVKAARSTKAASAEAGAGAGDPVSDAAAGIDPADVEVVDEVTADEPADNPDATTADAEASPVSGDDTESDSPVPGDDA